MNAASDPEGFPSGNRFHPLPHTREQTVVFNEEEPAGHVGLVFHTKPELMHILNPAITESFTGRRPYSTLHSSGIKGNNLASSLSVCVPALAVAITG